MKRTPLFEQRFIVDLDENTTVTLQFCNTNTAQLCYLCVQPTTDIYSGLPPLRPRGVCGVCAASRPGPRARQ